MAKDNIEDQTNNFVSREEFEALQAQYADLQKQLAKMVAADKAPEAPAKPEIPNKTFKVNGKEYKFKFAQFIIPGVGKRTALEALTDKDLLKRLVESNSGLVREIA